MNPTKFQLIEKLRQSKLTAAMTRSKAITTSPVSMPVCSAILAEAKRLGLSADEVATQFVSGQIHLPEIDMLMGKKPITASKPLGLSVSATASPKNPMPKTTPPAKPQPQTAWSTYQKLQAVDPIKASVFLAVNRAAVLASKPGDVAIQF